MKTVATAAHVAPSAHVASATDAPAAPSIPTSTGVPAATPGADSDWALVKRVKHGDVDAFDDLVRNHRERLYSIIYNLTSNREDAADLTQESFVKAFRSIQRFKGQSSFFTWLYRIAVNTTLSHLKKAGRNRFFSFDSLADDRVENLEWLTANDSRSNGQTSTLAAELQEKLNEALQNLSPKHRTVVILFEIEQLSHADIAAITGTSVGTVRSRLHYAKRQLQSDLAAYL